MEAFPDLATLSDADLKSLIGELEEEENRISFQRRMLHGKIDMLRAELVSRYKRDPAAVSQVDIDKLSEILAGKAAPPNAG